MSNAADKSISISYLNINNACRSCLNPSGTLDIFARRKNHDRTSVTIEEMLSACTQIIIEEGDGLPNLLCEKCSVKVADSFAFRLQARRSDEILRKFYAVETEEITIKCENEYSVESGPQRTNVQKIATKTKRKTGSLEQNNTFTKIRKKLTLKSDENLDRASKNRNQGINDSKPNGYTPLFTQLSEHSIDGKNKLSSDDLPCKSSQILYSDLEIKNEVNSSSDVDENYSENDMFSISDDETLGKSEPKETISPKDIDKNTKKIHPPMYDNPGDPQTCSDCNLRCPNIPSLINHRAKCHGPKRFQCLTCGTGLTTTRGFRIHMRLHTGEKPETCSTCGKKFSDPRTLKCHERIHTGRQPFPCMTCDKKYSSRTALKFHLRSHTGEKPFKCTICDKSYAKDYSLMLHMRNHTGIKPSKCKLCPKAFSNNATLSVHMLTHNGVKNYQCTFCGKRMARSGQLTVHLRTHTGERPYSCSVCNKGFMHTSGLRNHMLIHTGVKNFVCTICGKKVARSCELRVHMRSHTGERPYHCSCGKKFSTNSKLKLHSRKHTGEKPHTCNICSARFANSNNLRNHIRTHTGERPFSCNICGNSFAQQASLKTHLKTHCKAPKKTTIDKKKCTRENLQALDGKSSQDYVNMNDISFPKILTTSNNMHQTAIDPPECAPIEMHSNNT